MFGYIYRVKIKGKGNLGILVESIYTKFYDIDKRELSDQDDIDTVNSSIQEKNIDSPKHFITTESRREGEGEDELLGKYNDGTIDMEDFGVQVKEVKSPLKTTTETYGEDIDLESALPIFSMPLLPGDILLSLNKISLLGFTSSECVALLKASCSCEERILHVFRDSNKTFDESFMKRAKVRGKERDFDFSPDTDDSNDAPEGEDEEQETAIRQNIRNISEKEKRTSQFVQLLQGVPEELFMTIPFSRRTSQYILFTQGVKNIICRHILQHLFSPLSRSEMKGKGKVTEKQISTPIHSTDTITSDLIPPPPPLPASFASSLDENSSHTNLNIEEKDVGWLEITISTIPEICVGDIILEINGLHLKDMSYDLAHKILKAAIQSNGRSINFISPKDVSSEHNVDEESLSQVHLNLQTPLKELNLRILRIHHLDNKGMSKSLTSAQFTYLPSTRERDKISRRWVWPTGINELNSIKENLKGWSFVNSLCQWHKR